MTAFTGLPRELLWGWDATLDDIHGVGQGDHGEVIPFSQCAAHEVWRLDEISCLSPRGVIAEHELIVDRGGEACVKRVQRVRDLGHSFDHIHHRFRLDAGYRRSPC